MEYLRLSLNSDYNKNEENTLLSSDDSTMKVFFIPSNDELYIAKEELSIAENSAAI